MAYNIGYRRLTAEEVEELATWFAHLTTNEDPDKVMPAPEFYRPTIAYMQMNGMDLTGDESAGSMMPWFMPSALVDFHADVWYAQRIGTLRALREQRARAAMADACDDPDHNHDVTRLGRLFGNSGPGRA